MEKEKILLVDDDDSILEYLSTALTLAGYEVETASSAMSALTRIKALNSPYPVVLSDISMPGMDGIDFLRAMKKDYPETLVIMLTAHASIDTAVRSLNEGAHAYLSKPVNVDELKSVVKGAFEKFNLVRDNKQLVDELAKAKNYLETIVQNLVYIVVATDVKGYIRKTNRAMEKLLGYSENELIGSPLEIIFSQEFKETYWLELIDKGTVKDFPVAFLTKEGREVKLTYTGSIMKDAKGQVIGFLGTAQS